MEISNQQSQRQLLLHLLPSVLDSVKTEYKASVFFNNSFHLQNTGRFQSLSSSTCQICDNAESVINFLIVRG